MATKTFGGIKVPGWRKLTVEKGMIESRFPCVECNPITSHTTKLVCYGQMRPTDDSPTYRLRIEYPVWGKPAVYIEEPEIIPSAKIHIYKEGSLCLYYPKETPWKHQFHISDTILPWTAEWLVFYELYKLYGVWLGKSASHENEDKSEPNGELS